MRVYVAANRSLTDKSRTVERISGIRNLGTRFAVVDALACSAAKPSVPRASLASVGLASKAPRSDVQGHPGVPRMSGHV